MELYGSSCSCALAAESVTINGEYYRYDQHKRRKVSGPVTVGLGDVLRVGFTNTYSRLMLAMPMGFGFLALVVRFVPAIRYLLGQPCQSFLWKLCAALCLLTIPLYWLSYRTDLEINTVQGRYLLPREGMEQAQIAAFQREFALRRGEGPKAAKSR